MKKILPVSMAILLTAVVSVAAFGAKVVVKDIVTITVDKAQVQTDVPPMVVNGATMVPIRGVFNAFGAEIGWFPKEHRVFVREDSKVIWLRIGDAHAKVNDAIVPLQSPAMIYKGRTMVPLRFIAEALGANVNWDTTTQTITITTRQKANLGTEAAPAPAPAATAPAPQPMPAPPTQAAPDQSGCSTCPPDTSDDSAP